MVVVVVSRPLLRAVLHTRTARALCPGESELRGACEGTADARMFRSIWVQCCRFGKRAPFRPLVACLPLLCATLPPPPPLPPPPLPSSFIGGIFAVADRSCPDAAPARSSNLGDGSPTSRGRDGQIGRWRRRPLRVVFLEEPRGYRAAVDRGAEHAASRPDRRVGTQGLDQHRQEGEDSSTKSEIGRGGVVVGAGEGGCG